MSANAPDPNAPLEAFQRRLDQESQFQEQLVHSTCRTGHSPDTIPATVIHRGPAPSLDDLDAMDYDD
jgi:hypothetical protein